MDNITELSSQLYRRESGKIISILTRIFGTENLDAAEDVVQQTFIDAIQVWKRKGIPENPVGWLFLVAKNKAIDIIRKNRHSVHYDFSNDERNLLKSEYTLASAMDNLWKEELIADDQLRMMFACCHPEIAKENQVTLILKTLCGFSTAEIARAFLASEDTISKRLYRTKEFFRHAKIALTIPSIEELKSRTRTVLNAIYLLFNEGYYSGSNEKLVRKELIEEALLLCKLLAENEHTQLPEVYALIALICFHSARNESRITAEGEIILLPYQDRSKWDHALISQGSHYMDKASFGNALTSYHIEAAIAYEHCIARTFAETNWKLILDYYEWICMFYPSPITELNKVVAIMQVHGARSAFRAMEEIRDKNKLSSYYLYHSILGEIHAQSGDPVQARTYFIKAIELAPSEIEKKLIREKLEG